MKVLMSGLTVCVITGGSSRGSCAYRLLILHLLDAQVLQGDDSSGLFVLDTRTKKACEEQQRPTRERGDALELYSPWCTQSSKDSCP